jgi:hypothetical protein
MILRPAVIAEAVYNEQWDEDYEGNPLIEALDPLPEDLNMFMTGLAHEPALPTAADLKLPSIRRLTKLKRLRDVIFPLPEYKQAGIDLSMLLQEGYAARNPMTDMESRRATAIANWNINNPLKLPPGWKSSAAGHLFISSTGTGKTTFVTVFLSRIRQVIDHNGYKGQDYKQRQVVWIKLSVPPDGTLKAFCLSFFKEVDRLVGTNYLRQAHAAETVPKMTLLMGRVAHAIALGMLVIDEFQNLRATKSEQGVIVLNMFVSLIEDVGIPIVTLATPKVYQLFALKARDSRKLTDSGTTVIPLMSKGSVQWKAFCETLWKYTYTSTKPALTPAVVDAWYKASGGNAGFAVTAFRRAQRQAIIHDSELDEHTFEMVLNTDMAVLKPAIDALVSGRSEDIAVFEDLLTGPQAIALRAMIAPDIDLEPRNADRAQREPIAEPRADVEEEFDELKEPPPKKKKKPPKASSVIAVVPPLPKRSVNADL